MKTIGKIIFMIVVWVGSNGKHEYFTERFNNMNACHQRLSNLMNQLGQYQVWGSCDYDNLYQDKLGEVK